MRIAAILIALATAGSAAAYDPIVLEKGWVRVAGYDGETCAGEVGSNGKFYVLTVAGLAPYEPARLLIANGDMPPLDRVVRADGAGRWQDYYIPFRPNRGGGGYVTATLDSASCRVPLGFAWSRAIGWDEPPPLRPVVR